MLIDQLKFFFLRFFQTIIFISGLLLLKQEGRAQDSSSLRSPFKDTSVNKIGDTVVGKLRYPIADRRADFLSQPSNNPFDIRDSSLLKRRVEY
ncbi:MAG: hypothetical protein RLZZ391_802, partial [Bacteroidota bacterium]